MLCLKVLASICFITKIIICSEVEQFNCTEARTNCQISHTCGLQLHNVFVFCQTANYNSKDSEILNCSEDCRRALWNLEVGTLEGRTFTNCICSTADFKAQYCHSQNTLLSCLAERKSRFAHQKTVLSCNDARRYCEADRICQDALHYYETSCENHFHTDPDQEACPPVQCEDSFDILMRQSAAEFLKNCICDITSLTPKLIYCFNAAAIMGCRDPSNNGANAEKDGDHWSLVPVFLYLLLMRH